jgi:hypothetical protein
MQIRGLRRGFTLGLDDRSLRSRQVELQAFDGANRHRLIP